MPVTVMQMLEAANASVPRIGPAEARAMIAKGEDWSSMYGLGRKWLRAAR